MTTPTHEQEYIISLSELKRANVFMFTNKLKELSARPHTPAPKIPNSTELTQLAINDWHNREERKHRYELQPWVNGWITGFLTESKPYWSKEHDTAIHNAATYAENKRVLDAIEKFKTEAWARHDPCDGGFTKFYQSLRSEP